MTVKLTGAPPVEAHASPQTGAAAVSGSLAAPTVRIMDSPARLGHTPAMVIAPALALKRAGDLEPVNAGVKMRCEPE